MLLMLPAGCPGAAEAANAKAPAVLLASSEPIRAGVHARQRRRVLHQLAALQFGPVATVVSPEQVEHARDAADTASPPGPDKRLLEVEVAASPGPIARPALQSRIPFGLEALAWGARHPRQAWRLFLPILPADERAPAGVRATAPCRFPSAPNAAATSCG
ncbi:MAG: hypothetical protein KGJ68_05990 [Gammaproteobacteria bacterium]|nr:hypothetical protein [Gammaproteobacteria bacterium]